MKNSSLKKYNALLFVVSVSFIVSLLSVSIAYLLLVFTIGQARLMGLLVSFLVPLILVPPTAYAYVSLYNKLIDSKIKNSLLKQYHQKSVKKLNQLSGLLPICAHCKKIRNTKGKWKTVEVYLSEHSGAQFSHSLCPACTEKLYPGMSSETEITIN